MYAMKTEKQEMLMRLAMQEAALAVEEGNYPFGAVAVDADGTVIASAHNTQVTDHDLTAHAEINLIRCLAEEVEESDFNRIILICNAQSCSMCFSAAIKAGICNYIFGAPNEPHMNPYLPVAEIAKHSRSALQITYGVLEEECAQQIAAMRKKQGGRLAQ